MQRQVELDHKHIDQHQVANGHCPLRDMLRCQEHKRRDTDCDDQALTGIQRCKRGLVVHRSFFPDLQAFVVALRLETLVAEIFNGLVIEQAVDGAGVGFGIHIIHGAAKHHAPLGDN